MNRVNTASLRKIERINRSVENMTAIKKRGETPNSLRRPLSRGEMSRGSSISHISRLSINSEKQLKRKDSIDDIAKNLNDIEKRLGYRRDRQ